MPVGKVASGCLASACSTDGSVADARSALTPKWCIFAAFPGVLYAAQPVKKPIVIKTEKKDVTISVICLVISISLGRFPCTGLKSVRLIDEQAMTRNHAVLFVVE